MNWGLPFSLDPDDDDDDADANGMAAQTWPWL